MRTINLALRVAAILTGSLAIVAHAAPVKPLPGQIRLNCQLQDKVYTNKLDYVLNKVTPKAVPQVYFIKNKSNSMLVIDHPEKSGGAKAGWSSYLSPGKWSALAVSQTGFAVSCTINNQNKYSRANCAKLVSICQPTSGAVIQSNGNYWVAENKDWHDFIQIMKKKGVLTGN